MHIFLKEDVMEEEFDFDSFVKQALEKYNKEHGIEVKRPQTEKEESEKEHDGDKKQEKPSETEEQESKKRRDTKRA